MKKIFLLFISTFILINCTSSKNSEEFIKNASGRYLFNANEILEVYFEEQILYIKWRGKNDLKPLKVNDSTFYLADLNEKLIFKLQKNPYITLFPKTEHEGVIYKFDKLEEREKIPSEYITEKNYEYALISYQKIYEKDSLNPIVNERTINRLGYQYYRNDDFERALLVFKINNQLYPKSSNTFDSMADAYLRMKDTVNAIANYKNALSINPENRSSKEKLEEITKK